MSDFDNSNDDLIKTESLSTFSVVEQFCDTCGDLTPHHLADESLRPSKTSEHKTYEPPISSSECVYCKESEELDLNL